MRAVVDGIERRAVDAERRRVERRIFGGLFGVGLGFCLVDGDVLSVRECGYEQGWSMFRARCIRSVRVWRTWIL